MLERYKPFKLFSFTNQNLGARLIKRYFTDLDPIFSQYYTIPAVTLAGDFEIEVEFSTAGIASDMAVVAGSHLTEYYFQLDSVEGNVSVWVAGTEYQFATGVTCFDAKLHTLKVALVGTTLTGSIDGVAGTPLAITPYTGSNAFRIAAGTSVENFFSGIISNVKITDAGTLVRHYKIDENFALTDVLKNSATELGSEAGDTEATTVGAPWVDNGGGSYSLDGGQASAASVYFGSLLPIGKTYIVTFFVTDSTAGGVRPETAEIDESYATSNGRYQWVLSPIANPNFNLKADADFNGTVQLSIRQADGYGQAINITESEKYTLVDALGSAWLQPDTVVDGSFDNGLASWDGVLSSGDGSLVSVTGGVCTVKSNGDYVALNQAGIVSGKRYLYSLDHIQARAGASVIVDGLIEGAYSVPQVSPTTRHHVATANSDTFQLKRGGVCDTDVTNIKMRKIIQVAALNVHILGDSFVASLVFEEEMLNNFVARGCEFTSDGVGGSTLAQQKVRFDATTQYYEDVLVIMDGGLDDTAIDAKAAIDAIVSHLTHDKWVWVQPSPLEYIVGSAARIDWDAKVSDIAAHVGPSHHVECLSALKAANDGSADDLQDVADNIVPRSLRTDSIHETDYGLHIRTKSVQRFIAAKGW